MPKAKVGFFMLDGFIGWFSPTCRIENAIGEEGRGKPPHEIHFPRKQLRALSLVSTTLEIEYATRFSHSLPCILDI